MSSSALRNAKCKKATSAAAIQTGTIIRRPLADCLSCCLAVAFVIYAEQAERRSGGGGAEVDWPQENYMQELITDKAGNGFELR